MKKIVKICMSMLIIVISVCAGCGTGFDEGSGSHDGSGDNPDSGKSWYGTMLMGTSDKDQGYSTALDSAGNIYICGETSGAFDGCTNEGNTDIFLAKYNSLGQQLWVRQLGSTENDHPKNMALDKDDNIYITGWTWGSIDGETYTGYEDIFLVKYDSSGDKQWIHLSGSTTSDHAWNLTIDNDDIYVVGHTMGYMGDNESGSSNGGWDFFLAKYNSSGDRLWLEQIGTASGDYGLAVITDKSGFVYVSGHTGGAFTGYTNQGDTDIFLAMFSSLGTSYPVKQYGSSGGEQPYGLVMDSNENIYISGHTSSSLEGNTHAGLWDIFLAKYDKTREIEWVKQLGSAGNDASHNMVIDSNDTLSLVGYTTNNFNMSNDLLLAQYNTSGDLLKFRVWGSPADDVAQDIAVDANNDFYITGYTSGNLEGKTNNGGYDAFLMKLDLYGDI
ncbi:MAG: hypothetical protein GY754_01365 [bacterium]|nr:hypothetical protein [bacterium]